MFKLGIFRKLSSFHSLLSKKQTNKQTKQNKTKSKNKNKNKKTDLAHNLMFTRRKPGTNIKDSSMPSEYMGDILTSLIVLSTT